MLCGDIAVGHLVVPTAALREEGTSYHYFPPSRELTPSPAAVTAVEAGGPGGGPAPGMPLGRPWPAAGGPVGAREDNEAAPRPDRPT